MKLPDVWSMVRFLRHEASSDKSLAELPAPEREARLFAYALEHLPIGFTPGESLAGDFGIQYLEDDARSSRRFETSGRVSCSSNAPSPSPPTADPFQLLNDHFHCRAGYTPAHTCVDYERVLARGIKGLLEEVHAGKEISDMWGAVVNLLLPLELALNAGKPFQQNLSISLATPPRQTYATFDEIFHQLSRYVDELVSILVRRNWDSTQHVGRERPNPFLSALTRDCIARGRDRALGGARYHIVIVEGFGWANVADALTAVRRLAFDQGLFAIADIVDAARQDFHNADDLLGAILQCPKYGNADADADGMAARLAEVFAQCVRRHSHDNFYYAPSFHTLNAHVGAGKKLGASPDGRRAGEPLAKNIGPMIGRAGDGLTSVLLSASAIDQAELSGGQALDISIDPHVIEAEEGRRKFQSLLQTYFSRGGLQVQVNGVTADQLRSAIAAPQAYQDLTVKIAGYSARFVSLGREIQDEMVQRFEQGL